VLENEAIQLVCEPDLGARIVSLVDRATGREWLTQGDAPGESDGRGAWAGDEAVFGGEQAFGWDECLPTIARCTDPLDPNGPWLRDHGDLWGRPAHVELEESGRLVAGWQADGRWAFRRWIRLDGRAIAIAYVFESLGPAIPFLWSMHPLFEIEPGGAIEIADRDRVLLSHAAGIALASDSVGAIGWPVATTVAGMSVDLSIVRDRSAGTALKLAMAEAPAGPVVVRQPDGASISVEWDRALAPAIGLWLDHGGWPEHNGLSQVGVEPATSPDEDLATALERDRAARVLPGGEIGWWVRLTVESPTDAGTRR
jgi:hypothetical protein